MAPTPPGSSRNYDVYFTVSGGSRFFWRNPNHGISISDRGLVWTIDGAAHEAAFADIAAIHLQTAALGNANSVIDQCRIEFVDGNAMTASNGSATGLPDATQTPAYRDFVRDLHSHIAVHADHPISFTAGMSQGRYRGLQIALTAAGLFFVATPVVLAAVAGDFRILTVAAGGVFFCLPFVKLLRNNVPRDYTPSQLPEELLS
jgi:hypothetical protein